MEDILQNYKNVILKDINLMEDEIKGGKLLKCL